MPMFLSFTSDPDVTLSFAGQFVTSTENEWSFAGNGESTTTTSTFTSGDQYIGGNLEEQGKYTTSGTSVFDATSGRIVESSALQLIGVYPTNYPLVESDVDFTSDYLTPGNYAGSTCYITAAGHQRTLTETYSGSKTLSSGFDFDVDVGASISWADVGASISVSNVLEKTVSQSLTVTAVINVPSGGGSDYDIAYFETDSGGSSSTGIVAHVWQASSCP
ncbi:MAG: hypothetical protein WCB18_09445 [Thermoplasmata archaeon]